MVEYALLTAAVVLGLIAAADMLVSNAGAALEDNSGQIGTPRPYRNGLVVTTLPPPAAWAITTVPLNGFTLYDTVIRANDGTCWSFRKREVLLEPCTEDGTPSSPVEPDLGQLFSIEHYEETSYRLTIALSGECLVAKGRNGAPVLPQPCEDTPEETWELDRLDEYWFRIVSLNSGLCGDVTDGRLEEAVCDNTSPNQIFAIGDAGGAWDEAAP